MAYRPNSLKKADITEPSLGSLPAESQKGILGIRLTRKSHRVVDENGAEWFCGMRAISCVPAPWICTTKYNLFKLYVCTTNLAVHDSGHDTHTEAEWAPCYVSATDLDKQIKH